MTLDKEGKLIGLELVETSSFESLSKAAMETIRKVGKFPPIPLELGKDELTFNVPIDYKTQKFEEIAKAVDVVVDGVGGETLARSQRRISRRKDRVGRGRCWEITTRNGIRRSGNEAGGFALSAGGRVALGKGRGSVVGDQCLLPTPQLLGTTHARAAEPCGRE